MPDFFHKIIIEKKFNFITKFNISWHKTENCDHITNQCGNSKKWKENNKFKLNDMWTEHKSLIYFKKLLFFLCATFLFSLSAPAIDLVNVFLHIPVQNS